MRQHSGGDCISSHNSTNQIQCKQKKSFKSTGQQYKNQTSDIKTNIEFLSCTKQSTENVLVEERLRLGHPYLHCQ